MPNKYLPILASTALLTAAATVAQPQTTDPTTTSSTSSATSTTGTDTTSSTSATMPVDPSSTSTSTSGTMSTDADQTTTSGTSSSGTLTPDSDQTTTTGTRDTGTGQGLGTTGPMSTPQTTPGGTTTGTATDTTTGTQGMNGTFRGTPQSTTGTTTGTTGTDTTSGTSSTTSGTSGTTGSDATSGTSTSGYGSTSTDNDASTAGTAAGATATTASGSSQPQGQDAEFLRKAVEANRLEIASAQAALDNAQRSDTKSAAQMLMQDHQQAGEKLQQLASRKGWTLPAASSAESDQSRMTSTSGSGFDDRFMADQIRMHREAISLYRAEASSGSDPDLRQFARDTLPHLEHHLEMLQGANTQK